MLEDSRMYMNRMSSPVTPNITYNYETPVQPTPSIMNELEDAIITDLQVRYYCQIPRTISKPYPVLPDTTYYIPTISGTARLWTLVIQFMLG